MTVWFVFGSGGSRAFWSDLLVCFWIGSRIGVLICSRWLFCWVGADGLIGNVRGYRRWFGVVVWCGGSGGGEAVVLRLV